MPLSAGGSRCEKDPSTHQSSSPPGSSSCPGLGVSPVSALPATTEPDHSFRCVASMRQSHSKRRTFFRLGEKQQPSQPLGAPGLGEL
jgi:hypothetical protein